MLVLFAIKDVKAGAFLGAPASYPTRGVALRSFSQLAGDVNTEIGKYPGDFELWEIGEFDQVTGQLDAHPLVCLGTAAQYGTPSLVKEG